ncbi:V-type ATPase subunit [Hydrogenimonas sp.]
MGALLSKAVRFGYINAKCRALKSTMLGDAFFEKALRARSLGDIHALLKRSAYAPYVKSAEKEAMEAGVAEAFSVLYRRSTSPLKAEERRVFDLFFIERERLAERKLALGSLEKGSVDYKSADLAFIEKIKSALRTVEKGPNRDLKRILGSYFDLLNLYTIVRLRTIYRLEPEEIIPFLIPYGFRFDIKKLASLANLATLSDISEAVSDTIRRPFSGYQEFRQAVAAYHAAQLQSVWYGYPFKISVIFSLLRMKELELKRIRALVEGIHYRLPAEEIEKMVKGV